MIPLKQFVDSAVCRGRIACVNCRDTSAAGQRFRAQLSRAFTLPPGEGDWFDCPHGVAPDATSALPPASFVRAVASRWIAPRVAPEIFAARVRSCHGDPCPARAFSESGRAPLLPRLRVRRSAPGPAPLAMACQRAAAIVGLEIVAGLAERRHPRGKTHVGQVAVKRPEISDAAPNKPWDECLPAGAPAGKSGAWRELW